jgi:hypothetical protein
MRTYTCDICGLETSKNAMRDRRMVQISYMGRELILSMLISNIKGEIDVCRTCQDHIFSSIFKKNSINEMDKDSLRKLAGGYGEGPMSDMAQDMAAETSR